MPPRLQTPNLSTSLFSSSSVRSQSSSHSRTVSRHFSQSSCRKDTLPRREMYAWFNGPGAVFKKPLPGSTNYLGAYDKAGNLRRAPGWEQRQREKEASEKAEGEENVDNAKDGESKKFKGKEGQETPDELELSVRREEQKKKETDPDSLPPEDRSDLRPFPKNPYFRSEPVLSEELREAIYQRVVNGGASVSLASVEFGVSNERVGAVVRLKQLEKEWVSQGKTLAGPYARAVMDMLPKTPYIDPKLPENQGKRPVFHEPINDLIVHPATRQQLFVPVSESRAFTRVDAGKAFDNNLRPADERIPHPELVEAERDIVAGLSHLERKQRAQERFAKQEEKKKKMAEEKRQEALKNLKTVPGRRWDFVFQDISVDAVGQDGRNPGGVGWRYGFPHEDRKKGQVKIPTRVEA